MPCQLDSEALEAYFGRLMEGWFTVAVSLVPFCLPVQDA